MARLLLATALIALALLTACGGAGAPAPTSTPLATPTPEPATSTPLAPSPPGTGPPPPATDTPAAPTPPPPGAAATVIRRIEGVGRVAVLTFDAGSDAGYTSLILDTLAANGITASFGMTGRWAEENPDLLRRIVRDGHDLINHSYDHASFTGLSTGLAPLTREQRRQQLDRTEQVVRDLTGATTLPYFRPPYGDHDASVNADVGARGYAYNVMWTVDSGGWRGIHAQAIIDRCLSLAEPGAVYVFHVGSASQDGPALQGVIDGLRAQGYTFAPLSAYLR